MTQIVLHGAGRMAAAIVKAARQDSSSQIRAVVAPGRPDWDDSIPYFSSFDQLPGIPEGPESRVVLIDFSLPDGVATAAHWCAANRVALLCGVTGLQAPEMDSLRLAANTTAVLWSPNLSLGVNLLAQLCAMAARVMKPETRVSIADTHHQWKQDAPSGTALMLGAAIDAGRSGSVPAISYSSVREGEIIGQHSVTLEWPGEKIVLQHEALDRALFAEGALDAGRWLSRQTPGFYSAADWLAGRS